MRGSSSRWHPREFSADPFIRGSLPASTSWPAGLGRIREFSRSETERDAAVERHDRRASEPTWHAIVALIRDGTKESYSNYDSDRVSEGSANFVGFGVME